MPKRFMFSSATGDDLRALRERIGWTQEEFAALLFVTRSAMCRYETGKAPIPSTTWELANYKTAHLLRRQPRALGFRPYVPLA
jgi:transcriptional regulator with XRE-family HTH domain